MSTRLQRRARDRSLTPARKPQQRDYLRSTAIICGGQPSRVPSTSIPRHRNRLLSLYAEVELNGTYVDRYKNPIEIHGTAATTMSPTASARR